MVLNLSFGNYRYEGEMPYEKIFSKSIYCQIDGGMGRFVDACLPDVAKGNPLLSEANLKIGRDCSIAPLNLLTANENTLYSSLEEYEKEKDIFEFVEYEIGNSAVRKIKVVNGYLTNDFFDFYEGGQVLRSSQHISIEDIQHFESINSISVASENVVDVSLIENKQSYLEKLSKDGYSGIFKIGDQLCRVELIPGKSGMTVTDAETGKEVTEGRYEVR